MNKFSTQPNIPDSNHSHMHLLPKKLISPLVGETPLFFGKDSVSHLKFLLSDLLPDKIAIIADERVLEFHRKRLQEFLPPEIPTHWITLQAGETNKNWNNLEILCLELFQAKLTKTSIVINFGGGVTLNMGGLAASLVYRGLRFIQVPTSFLAQSDVIVSNKQSINFAGGKNRLGAYQPATAVIIDPQWLSTENDRLQRAALIEYAKNALLLGEPHYGRALAHLGLKERPLYSILERSLEQKFEIAHRDPTEKGYGLALEYGHTVGHALEYHSHGQLLHGEAVWFGMQFAGVISVKMGFLQEEDYQNHQKLLELCRPNVNLPPIEISQFLDLLDKDNKKIGNEHRFILLDKIGQVHQEDHSLLTKVPQNLLINTAKEMLNALL